MILISSLRRNLRAPGFTVAVLLLVAAVVAINATTFAALHGLRWKALPYAEPDQLVELQAEFSRFGITGGLSEMVFDALPLPGPVFESAVGFRGSRSRDEAGRDWQLTRATPGFAQALGVAPLLGRVFAADEAHEGAGHVLLLSHHAWQARFGADPGIVGRPLKLGDVQYTVIGVMPPEFAFPNAATEAWLPFVASAAERAQEAQGYIGNFEVLARLAPTASIDQARQALAAVFEGIPALAGKNAEMTGLRAAVRPWRERFSADRWQVIALLQAAGLLLLVVVASSLANLLIDRMLARQREFAVCRSLGARERDVALRVLADLLPPVLAGLALGLLAVPAGVGLLRSRGLLPENLPVSIGGDLATVLGATGFAAAVLLGGLLTALLVTRRRSGRGAGLGERSSAAGLGRTRGALLVGQIALTVALLGGTGLLLRSAGNLMSEPRGFDANGVLLTRVEVDDGGAAAVAGTTADGQTHRATMQALRDGVMSLPGVQQVALADAAPFARVETVSQVRLAGVEEPVQARVIRVDSGYFEALGIPLQQGSVGGRHEPEVGPVVVDELFRRRWLQDVDPLAAVVGIVPANDNPGYVDVPVRAVVPTLKFAALDEEPEKPTVYRLDPPQGSFFLVTRAEGDAALLVEPVRERIRALLPQARVSFNQPLNAAISLSLRERRALLEALALFAGLTLALSALGLYAVLSFAVRRRTTELGVRMALGAGAPRILRLVMGQGLLLLLGGLLLGLALGLPLADLLADRLYRLTPTDSTTWLLSVAALSIVALLACWLPAWRATRVAPSVALRPE